MKAELTNKQVIKFWTYFVGKTEDILILILILINTFAVNNILVMCILNPYTSKSWTSCIISYCRYMVT